MKVTVNNRELVIFAGATVTDAVRAYSLKLSRLMEKGRFRVYDQFGNLTEADGELTEGAKIFLRKNHEKA